MSNPHRHRYFLVIGSTVIEVLIATTVIAFALTGLAMLMTANVKNSAEADYREAAAGIAQDTMEKIRQYKETTSWTVFRNAPTDSAATGCNSVQTRYNTSFWIQCTRPTASASEPTSQYTLQVKVCWPATTSCSGAPNFTEVVQTFFDN